MQYCFKLVLAEIASAEQRPSRNEDCSRRLGPNGSSFELWMSGNDESNIQGRVESLCTLGPWITKETCRNDIAKGRLLVEAKRQSLEKS